MVMKNTLAAALLAVGALTIAAPAQAGSNTVQFSVQIGQPQWGGHKPVYKRTLSPQQVRKILRSRGYRDIRYVDRRGSIYQARGERNGKDFRLLVNAYSGKIFDGDRIRG